LIAINLDFIKIQTAETGEFLTIGNKYLKQNNN